MKWLLPIIIVLWAVGVTWAVEYSYGVTVVPPAGGSAAFQVGITPTPSPTPTPAGTPTPQSLVWSGGTQSGGQAFNVSTYFPASGYIAVNSATAETWANKISAVRSLNTMCCTCSPGMSGGNSLIINLRDQLVDTGLKVTITSTSGCDTGDTFVTARGDLLEYRVMPSPGPTPTATPGPYQCTCSVGN